MSEPQVHDWPTPPGAGPLGDGRCAVARPRPGSVEELCQAVADHARQGLAIYPQGGGTALDYGNPPGRPGAALETGSLRRVIDYPHADMTITVEAGITGAELQYVLAEKNQRLLVDIPQADRATLGGVFATNTCGPRRFGVGRPRDQIIGVSFVNAEGDVIKGGGRVVKNVAGYDFPKLLSGSLGTLGIIVQMTLKVRPIPDSSAIVWVPLDGLGAADDVLARLNRCDARPIAIELLNAGSVSSTGSPLAPPAGEWALAIGLEDNSASVRWQISRLMIELGRTDLTVREGVEAEELWSALIEFQAAEPGPVSFLASVPPSRVVPLLELVNPASWAVQAHAGNGIIRLQARGDRSLDQTAEDLERFRLAAAASGGSVVVSRCPSDWKSRLSVWGPRRSDWVVAEQVKRALDPGAVFNPGRFVGDL